MNDIVAEVLDFLKFEHQADVVAMAMLAKSLGTKWEETDESVKMFRRRQALIARIERATEPQSGDGNG